ncbi:MAG: ABC transporter permease [Alphaproteobacteria bacterium]|nr:ABC transporter permease [Alphaproteobacteria bacterium SS10]
MDFYLLQGLTGLASAASLFLVAAGLTIIFGVARVVNFAHGSFFMLGAYIGVSLMQWLMASPLGPGLGFWLALPIAAIAVGAIGVIFEVAVLRRLYRGDELLPLLASFALVLMLQDVTRLTWGPEEVLGPRAPLLDGSIRMLGGRLPTYDIFLIVLAPLVLGALWLLFHRTRFGVLVRAATDDREMLAALGTDQKLLFTLVFFLGAALAGLGGALQLPRGTANLEMDLAIIAEVFVVVVIGGMGSITGAFLAALLVGLVQAYGLLFIPEATLVLIFLIMAVVLAVRPNGLLGRPLDHGATAHHRGIGWQVDPIPKPLLGVLALLLLAAPLYASDYLVSVIAEFWVLALFASSLYLIMGTGGLVSFGHAALFGTGAYTLAFISVWTGGAVHAWWSGLLLAVVSSAAMGMIIGAIATRRQGVYLAMLTLAAAQILWSLATQWLEVTGGDNGILGLWLPDALRHPAGTYWFMAAISLVGLLLIRRVDRSGLGLSLRAIADAPQRAAMSGLKAWPRHVLIFAIAGAFAGLAGALHALLKGSVFPNDLGIPLSVDALAMLLLGGIGTVTGPIIGAALFFGIKVGFQIIDFWRFILGALIILTCVAAPGGVAAALTGLRQKLRGGSGHA